MLAFGLLGFSLCSILACVLAILEVSSSFCFKEPLIDEPLKRLGRAQSAASGHNLLHLHWWPVLAFKETLPTDGPG